MKNFSVRFYDQNGKHFMTKTVCGTDRAKALSDLLACRIEGYHPWFHTVKVF
jgi:hypothetical protein